MKTGQQTRRTFRLAFSFPMLAALGLGGPVLAASKTAFVVVGSGLETILNTRRALFAEMIGKLVVVANLRKGLEVVERGLEEAIEIHASEENIIRKVELVVDSDGIESLLRDESLRYHKSLSTARAVRDQLKEEIDRLHRPFLRGDANGDEFVDISDVIAILSFLYEGEVKTSCLAAADANDDETLDLSDAVSTAALFLGTGGLPLPGPAPGLDPTPGIGCRGNGLFSLAVRAN
jgi:hypothetical protein